MIDNHLIEQINTLDDGFIIIEIITQLHNSNASLKQQLANAHKQITSLQKYISQSRCYDYDYVPYPDDDRRD